MDGSGFAGKWCELLVDLVHTCNALVLGEVSSALLATAIEFSKVLVYMR